MIVSYTHHAVMPIFGLTSPPTPAALTGLGNKKE
jgi:hypothetical protein